MANSNMTEKQWKPVCLNSHSAESAIREATGGFGVSNDVTKQYNWYQRLVSNHGKRKNKLQRYDEMDATTDIARALDVIAEDVSSVNADEEEPFVLSFDENADVNKTMTKTLETMKKRWMKRTELDKYFYDYIRETIKYGATFLLENPDMSLKYLVPERIHGYILDANDDSTVSHYLYNDKGNYRNQEGDNIGNSTGNREDYASIPVDDFVLLKIGDGPFGQSVLDRVFKVWRQLQMLEDSIVIYRVVRAPERRVFYIDIGSMPPHKAESYIERMKIKMRQSQSSKGGEASTDYDPHSMQEDFFIPQTGQGRGSRIDTLQGGCLTMDTKVSLLDGRELSIESISQEMDQGKELWTYSTEPYTGKIVPGIISWAGVTQKSAQVMRLTLDNGEQVTCTLDHNFPVYGKGFVEAQDLVVDDSMIPLNRKHEKIDKKSNFYEMVFDNEDKSWKFTHSLMLDYLSGDVVNEWSYFDDSVHNHRITNIEFLDEPQEVGTLTIDQNEDYHDYHTFALSCGIFTKNSNLGELEDLQYFNKKLALGLRIPPGYMDTYSDSRDSKSHEDGRVGTLYVAEMRYLGFIRRIQKKIADELFENFKKYCKKNGVTVPAEGVDFDINSPQSFAEYKEAEKNQMLLNVQNSTDNIPGLSKRFSMKKYLQLSEEEMIENEHMLLKEMGLTDDEIKNLDEHLRYNLLYGDKGRAKKDGGFDWMSDDDGGGGFGGF